MGAELIPVLWRSREPPLAPCAVAACGEHARALARRLLRSEDARLAALRGISSADTLLVLGDANALPWIDGAIYLGRDPEASALLVPTTLSSQISPPLLERALLARTSFADRPLALLTDPLRVIATGAALPIARHILQTWLMQAER